MDAASSVPGRSWSEEPRRAGYRQRTGELSL